MLKHFGRKSANEVIPPENELIFQLIKGCHTVNTARILAQTRTLPTDSLFNIILLTTPCFYGILYLIKIKKDIYNVYTPKRNNEGTFREKRNIA